MKPFSRDWSMYTLGFFWAFACGCLVSLFTTSWAFSTVADEMGQKVIPPKCQTPLVEMDEYRSVVHALDRCYQRLDEEQQNLLDMQGEVEHWNYVEQLTYRKNPDEEIDCQLLLHRALQDVWFDAEDETFKCWQIQRDECWCPFEMGQP